MGDLILRDILFIFLAAVPVILVLNRLRLPPVTGFILTGALIGPSGLGLIPDSQRIETLAQIGVTLLLFSIGLEFSVAPLAKLKTYVLKGGLLQILACIAFGTAAVTMLGTPLMVKASIPFSEFLARLPVLRKLAFSPGETAVQEEVRPYAGHVIICGFGPLGEALGHLLERYRIPHVILELNPETVERTREKKKEIFFGDGASEEILYRSGVEKAKMLAITVPDYFNNVSTIRQARRLNPEITIVARAKYRGEVESLYDAGADVVVSEELEGGIEMGRCALLKMGVESGEVNAYIDKIREFGSADFF